MKESFCLFFGVGSISDAWYFGHVWLFGAMRGDVRRNEDFQRLLQRVRPAKTVRIRMRRVVEKVFDKLRRNLTTNLATV